MKLFKNDTAFRFQLGKILDIYGHKKTEHSNKSFAVDLYAFGYRFRWYPTNGYFGIREWA